MTFAVVQRGETMSDCMTFPDTVEEFMEQYKVVDTDGIYMSKGAELVPIFRMRQWFEHLPSAQPEIIRCKDCKYYEIAWLKQDGTDDKRYKPSVCVKGRYAVPQNPDWFCADAERRANE